MYHWHEPTEERLIAETAEDLKAKLGADRFERAFAAGLNLSLDAAVELALRTPVGPSASEG